MTENQRRRNQGQNQNRSNRNQRRNQNGQARNFKKKDDQTNDKKVPMKYGMKTTKTLKTIELKLDIDERSEKVKLPVFEDGSDEQFFKLVKEFQNMTSTYELWEQDNGTRTVYRSFRRCLGGSARDLWDQVIENEEEEMVRDELTFENHLWELTKEIVGLDAYRNQKEYLKRTGKPDGLSVKI
jgi:hypothetical protein